MAVRLLVPLLLAALVLPAAGRAELVAPVSAYMGIREYRRIRRPFVVRQLRRALATCGNLRWWLTRRSRAS